MAEQRGMSRRDLIRDLALGAMLLTGCRARGVCGNKDDESEIGPKLGPNASLGGKAVFPPDNPWNVDVSEMPVDPNSDTLIAVIGPDKPLHPDFGPAAASGIPYVAVSGSQPRTVVRFESDESDEGYYPIPADAPVEGGPNANGDRHVLVIDRDNWKLYELFAARKDAQGWRAGSGAIFDLNSNALRPAGWTSADAAGLPVFPGLVRYDEVHEQKAIRHALRFTVRRTRRAYVWPARHFASRSNDPKLPPMGMRVRLKASFDVSGFSPGMQVVLTGLKKYGMFLADNGSDWFVTGAPDPRWSDAELNTLKRVRGRDFEVVLMGQPVTR
jgi:hypothetical protein